MTQPIPQGPALVPELICSDFARTRDFYVNLLGFKVLYDRPEHNFAYLERDGVEIMIEQFSEKGSWVTGEMTAPFGRGINLQIDLPGIDDLLDRLRTAGIPLYREPYDAWYRVGDSETGQRQFLVQDPDGYLLRFCQQIGERPLK